MSSWQNSSKKREHEEDEYVGWNTKTVAKHPRLRVGKQKPSKSGILPKMPKARRRALVSTQVTKQKLGKM